MTKEFKPDDVTVRIVDALEASPGTVRLAEFTDYVLCANDACFSQGVQSLTICTNKFYPVFTHYSWLYNGLLINAKMQNSY